MQGLRPIPGDLRLGHHDNLPGKMEAPRQGRGLPGNNTHSLGGESRVAAHIDMASRVATPAVRKQSSPDGTPERKAIHSKYFLTILLVAPTGTSRG